MTNAQHANENLTVHLKVKDYAIWRTGYDGREKSRVSAGITNGRVFRRAEDQNDVVILQDVADVAKARTWLASDEMKAAMEKGGVVGSPKSASRSNNSVYRLWPGWLALSRRRPEDGSPGPCPPRLRLGLLLTFEVRKFRCSPI